MCCSLSFAWFRILCFRRTAPDFFLGLGFLWFVLTKVPLAEKVAESFGPRSAFLAHCLKDHHNHPQRILLNWTSTYIENFQSDVFRMFFFSFVKMHDIVKYFQTHLSGVGAFMDHTDKLSIFLYLLGVTVTPCGQFDRGLAPNFRYFLSNSPLNFLHHGEYDRRNPSSTHRRASSICPVSH